MPGKIDYTPNTEADIKLMLKEIGVEYVIIGHSERRQYFGETDATVNQRLKAALAAGLKPIVCVGEMLEDREQGMTEKVLLTQLEGGLANISAEEMAAELSNPNTPVSIMNTNFDYMRYDGNIPGASDQSGFSILFQPSIPYPLGGGKNFFLRPSFPVIIEQPVFNTTSNTFESEEGELGDIGLDASVGISFDADGGKNIMLLGGTLIMPTATGELGSDQWQLGPFFGGSMLRKWGSVALFASQLYDVAGDDSFDTNMTAGQYFYSINLNGGWQVIGTPTWSYDYEASSNNAASFPIAVGIAKTAIINSRPWQFTLEYWNYVIRPDDFGVEHQVRITIGPVVKLPWKKR